MSELNSNGRPSESVSDFGSADAYQRSPAAVPRLDSVMERHSQFDAVSPTATHVYIDSMIHMVARQGLPLAVIAIGFDESTTTAWNAEDLSSHTNDLIASLRTCTRPYDVVGILRSERGAYGGDCIVVCPLMDETAAAGVAERARRSVAAALAPNIATPVLISAGVAAIAIDAADSNSLIARAEEALKSARRAGGNKLWRRADTLNRIALNNPRQSP